MFNSKLNYLTCGFALAFLLLLGRFFFMQVVNHEAYTAAAEDVRLRKELLPPSRAAIYAAGGTLVARSETVWDVYIDWNEFSQPRSMRLRALVAPGDYDPGAVQAFLEGPAREVEAASLAAPAARRRFFLTWRLREQEAARHDLRQSLARLSMVTRVPQERIEEKLALVQAEVDGLLAELGDVTTARANDVNVAWLRAKPALSDSEYWNRVKRYPRSTAFLPALEARLKWSRHEAEYLQAMLQRAGDDRQARDLCGQAARNCEARALALAPDDESARSLEPAAREERAAFRRLFSTCSEGVHRGAVALHEALDALQGPAGRIAALEDRALSLRRDTVERFQGDYERRWRHYTFEENPLLLLRDAPRDVVELLKVNADLLPGVSCRLRASRAYAHASLLAPVLGAVMLPDADRLDDLLERGAYSEGLDEFIETWFDGDREAFVRFADGVVAQQPAGSFGVERAYDARLSGSYGARVSVHDARGRIRSIEFEKAPVNAEPLHLTIDLDLTRDILESVARWEPRLAAKAANKTSEMLRKGQIPLDRWQRYKWSFRGAAVVLDVKTGAVLALVSFPTYDPERMSGASDADRVYRLQLKTEAEVEGKMPYWARKTRQVNRASGATYHPGSTWKVLTSIALMEEGGLSLTDRFDEVSNTIEIAGVKLKTGHPAGPNLGILDALERSSNGFYYYFSQRLAEGGGTSDWETMRLWAEKFGFGTESGFELPGTRRANLADIGRVGQAEVSTMSIGQGKLLVTPLEMARFYACVAARGRLSQPHLSDEAMALAQDLEVRPGTWDTIHEGLKRVVIGAHGTARPEKIDRSRVLVDIRCAGKTGTAENGKGVPDHAWFAGFAPYEDPQVAFVMLAEYSDLYGADVAPVIGECIQRYLVRQGVLPSPVVQRR